MRRTSVLIGAVASAAAAVFTLTGASALQTYSHDPGGHKVYATRLAPLNAGEHHVGSGTITVPTASGAAVIAVKGDDVRILIKVNGVTAGTVHPQHIHAGTTCPTSAADTNHDGFVDVIEGLPAYGPILVPLDSEVNDLAGASQFPTANGSGRYLYYEEASKSHLQRELQEALRLQDRHVVIHGINPTDPLPASVQSLPGLPAQATLPVACGELTQVH